MFRVRVAVIFSLAMVALTVAVLIAVTRPVQKQVIQEVEGRVDRAARLCENRWLLDASDLRRIADTLAHEAEIVRVFTQPGPERRQKAFVAVEGYSVRMREALGQKADVLALVDAGGKVLARDLDPAALYDEDLKARYATVAVAFKEGKAVKDIWNFQGKMYRVGFAPVKAPDGAVLGGVLVGYVLTAKDARNDANNFGTEVAYFMDGRVQATSFAVEGTESAGGKATEDVERAQALTSALFTESQIAASVLQTQRTSDMMEIRLKDEVYRAKVGVIPENATDRKSGYVVLVSVTQAMQPVAIVRNGILALGLAGLIAGLFCAMAVGRHFLRGLDQIELGTSEVISGNMDYAFDAQVEEVEGLANSLNVLLARLLGRPEPGDDEDEEGGAGGGGGANAAAKAAEIFTFTEARPTPGEAESVARESDTAHVQRIYNEYINARRQNGEPADLTFENFAQKLRANEAMLRAKHDCRMVRFAVDSRAGRTALRPIPIT